MAAGAIPSKASFAMHAALINHYMYGASYPKGGASEIAHSIIPVIEKAGGKVLVRAMVSEILFNEKGRAMGEYLMPGWKGLNDGIAWLKMLFVAGVRVARSSGSVDVFAPVVISDAGAINTFKTLVPKPIAEKSSENASDVFFASLPASSLGACVHYLCEAFASESDSQALIKGYK